MKGGKVDDEITEETDVAAIFLGRVRMGLEEGCRNIGAVERELHKLTPASRIAVLTRARIFLRDIEWIVQDAGSLITDHIEAESRRKNRR